MKEIKLSQGKIALIDDEDYELVSVHKWHAWKTKRSRTYYARSNIRSENGNYTVIYMHRLITGVVNQSIEIDHDDHDGLNNRRYNLKTANREQNCRNVRKHLGCLSEYKGVSWHNQSKSWRARIRIDKRQIHLGLFVLEVEAAKAYNEAACKYFGAYAFINIIEEI